jgi:hypothetical protein
MNPNCSKSDVNALERIGRMIEEGAERGGLEFQNAERAKLRAMLQYSRYCWATGAYQLQQGNVARAVHWMSKSTHAISQFKMLKQAKAVRNFHASWMKGTLVLGRPGSTIIGSEIDYLANIARKYGAFAVVVGGSAQHEYSEKLHSHGAPVIGFSENGVLGLPDMDVSFIADPNTVMQIAQDYGSSGIRADHPFMLMDSFGGVNSVVFADSMKVMHHGPETIYYATVGDEMIQLDPITTDPRHISRAVSLNVAIGNLVIIPIWGESQSPGANGSYLDLE